VGAGSRSGLKSGEKAAPAALTKIAPSRSVGFHPSPDRFGFGPVLFRPNHVDLLGAALLPVAPARPFVHVPLPRRLRTLVLLQFPVKFGPGQEAIDRLGSLPLAADLDAGGAVSEPDARTGFLDLLAAVARSKDETLVDVIRPHPERAKPLADSGIQDWGKIAHDLRCP
jgi:hypothetical protein